MISFQIAGMVIIIVILTFYLSQKRMTLRSGQLFVIAAFFVSILLVVDIYSIYGNNILIGIYKNDDLILLDDNQDLKEKIILTKDDSFVYFKY